MSGVRGKSKYSENGYTYNGTVVLLTAAKRKIITNGKLQWKAFALLEKAPKRVKNGDVAMNITTGYKSDLAEKLIEWPKGTTLLISGTIQLSDWWTQHNGKETYELVVDAVLEQPDYYAAYNAIASDHSDSANDDYNDYDPGF